jgi:hypothetical protein
MLSNGKQAHNARELVKAAKFKGQWLNMARQPIPAAKVREILALTGQRPHANTGRFMPSSQLAKLRKLAKRELLARQGNRVVGPMPVRITVKMLNGKDFRVTVQPNATVRDLYKLVWLKLPNVWRFKMVGNKKLLNALNAPLLQTLQNARTVHYVMSLGPGWSYNGPTATGVPSRVAESYH